jgi:hypothetical protein
VSNGPDFTAGGLRVFSLRSHPSDLEDAMTDRSRLLQEANEAFGELRQAIAGLDEGQAGRVWLGTWGVREILIHISGWHREMIPALEAMARNAPSPHPPGHHDDFDAWNARFVQARRGVKLADVLTELDASHRAFVNAASAVPETAFSEGGDARGLVDGIGAGHYREHTAQITSWRKNTDV